MCHPFSFSTDSIFGRASRLVTDCVSDNIKYIFFGFLLPSLKQLNLNTCVRVCDLKFEDVYVCVCNFVDF